MGRLQIENRGKRWGNLVALLIVGGGALAAAAGPVRHTYYIGPAGRDTNPGTSAAPWGTPGYASRRLKPGDTLIVLDGRYVLSRYDEDIVKPPAGKPDAWITIQGEPGKRPVLAGRNNLIAAIDLAGASFIRIENLEITHDDTATGGGLRDGIESLGQPAHHVLLQDLYIHHIDEMGVNMGDVSDMQVLHSRLEYCGFGGLAGPAGEHGGWQRVLIKGCTLSYSGHYYQGGDGSKRPYDRPDGLGLEPAAGPLVIADTRAEHNYGDGLDSKISGTYIHHCVVANNSCDGIKLWGGGSRVENSLVYGTGDGVGGDSAWAGLVIDQIAQAGARFDILNVTIADNPTRHNYPMYVQYDGQAPITLVMRNSIVANGYGPVFIGKSVALTADHNLFYAPEREEQVEYHGRTYTAAEIEDGALGPANLVREPGFTNPAWGRPGDFHLQLGSPALDAGIALGPPTTDLDGVNRPQGKGWDLGAYELPVP